MEKLLIAPAAAKGPLVPILDRDKWPIDDF
jgi:hypothetical protein